VICRERGTCDLVKDWVVIVVGAEFEFWPEILSSGWQLGFGNYFSSAN